MEEKKDIERRECPYCGSTHKQHGIGLTKAGSRRFRCGMCKRDYTPKPKKWVYTEEERKAALRKLTDGATGRAVGRDMKMSKANAYRWAREAAKKGR